MSVGALSHFGYAEASAAAPGTLPTISKFLDPTTASIEDKFPREAVPTMREDRSQVRSVGKIVEVSVSMESLLLYNALPFFFKMALGACSTAAAGTAYKHTFLGAKTVPSFGCEVSYDTAGAIQAAGCKANTLNIKAQSGEAATVSMEAIGLSTTKNAATALSGLPADDNVAVFSHATVTFGGTANTDVISMDLGIDNGAEAVKTLNGTSFATRICEGVRKITCGLDMDFRNQDMYDLSRAATSSAVVLNFTSPVVAGGGSNYYMVKITLPNVKFSAVSAPVSADGIISQKLEAVPLYDAVATNDIKIEVVNTDVSYPNVA